MKGGLSHLLLGNPGQRQQMLRIRRFGMSLASYLMWYGFAVAALLADLLWISATELMLAGLGILVSQTIFYVLLRSGLNRRFSDPSMTLAQIIVGLAWGLLLIAVTREIRGLMLSVYMVTLLFGVFALGKRQFIGVGVLAFLAYVGLVVVESQLAPGALTRGYYLVSTVILGFMLVWTSLFGSYVSNLRYRLTTHNQSMEGALDRIRTLAERDELTGLYNRRFIMACLEREKARADRSGSRFSICIIDLDHFKVVNDRYGHNAGDEVLRGFASFMLRELRSIDIPAMRDDDGGTFGRYGGEEFILLLSDTDLEGARRCAERLRTRQAWMDDESSLPQVTLSAGVAEYVPGESIESLLRRADHALYDAKNAGRNKVHVAH